jgi:carbamoyltransferase
VHADNEHLVELIAALLVRGAAVGWVQGRLEFGPRALGSRSILATPCSTAIRDRVNRLVKDREDFRPLAPVVMADHMDNWFVVPTGTNVRHMTAAVQVRPHRRSRIEGVVHADETSRIQSLERDTQPLLWSLIDRFRRETGVPMLLNTSLNGRGMPIARSADDAMEVFRQTELDVLVVGNDVWMKDGWRDGAPSSTPTEAAG